MNDAGVVVWDMQPSMSSAYVDPEEV